MVKNLPANAGDEGSISSLGRSHMLQSLCPIVLEPQLLKPVQSEPVPRHRRSHHKKTEHH